MPFQRPTLTALIERILADLSSRMVGVAGAVLRRSVLGALGRAEGGAAHELHGHLEWISRQVIIDTSDEDILLRWADIWGIRQKPAQFASGGIVLAGTDGSIIDADTVLYRQDGAMFATQAAVTVVNRTATALVKAQLAGVAGNTVAGVALTLQQPVAGVDSTAVVDTDGIVNGSDVEKVESLRQRLLAHLRKSPQGGAAHDYEAWALEVPGVTRVWVKPAWMGLGTVGVIFVRDDDPSIIPDAGEIDAVATYIEARRPVTATVYVLGPTPTPIDFDIQLRPNTPAVQDAVRAELVDLLRRESEPGGTTYKSRLDEAVSTAAGEEDHFIVSPVGNISHSPGGVAVLGAVTFHDLP